MSLHFAIEDARAFRNTGFQPLRPLTLLVGENSSGKTSFFALLHEAISYFGFSVEANPFFDLGGMEDIAHRHPGSGKHGNSYTLSFYLHERLDDLSKALSFEIDGVGLSITYGESRGLRICTKLSLSFGPLTISFSVIQTGSAIRIQYGSTDVSLRAKQPRTGIRDNYYLSTYYGVSGLLGSLRAYAQGRSIVRPMVPIEGRPADELRALAPVLAIVEQVFDRLDTKIGGAVSPTTAMRSAPQRVYAGNPASDSQTNGTPNRLYRIKQYEPALWRRLQKGLENFGRSSGLFDHIDVRSLRGRRSSGPFEILVIREGIESNIVDVGYGVSQALPFISDVIIYKEGTRRRRGAPLTLTYYIQQPETHLHPAAQAAIGSFFYDLSQDAETRVILETHSDFIVDRIRQHISRDERDTTRDVVMLFFDNREGVSMIYPVEFDRSGNVLGAPPRFRDFFIREELRNLGMDDVSDNR